MREADGLDAEIINDEAEGDGSPFVPPEAGGILTLVIPFLVESLCKEFVG